MRRMFSVLAMMAVLLPAVPAVAQQTATVRIDFPGAAAVEAGMNDPKPVDPDPQGRRRASIVVPLNDQGTVYAMTQPNGTVVVRLVSSGQPAPSGFKAVGTYRAGQELTFDTKTLTVSQGPGSAPTTSTGNSPISFGVRGGIGTGSLSDLAENCDEFIDEFGLSCSGDDRGFVWTTGADVRWHLSEIVDLTLRGNYTRTPTFSVEANGTIEGLEISSTGSGHGHIWTFAGELGVSPAPRWRIYGGGGLSPFTFDSETSISAFGLTERSTQENSGLGRTGYFGIEHALSHHFSIFGEAGRTWLKDDDVADDEEPFDEAFTTWIVGVRWSFPPRHIRR